MSKWLYGRAELTNGGGNMGDYSCLGALFRIAFLELWFGEMLLYLAVVLANALRAMFLS